MRLYCPECHRFAQFAKARLLERCPPDYHMHTFMNDLTSCKRVRDQRRTCQVVFDLMSNEKRPAALAKGGLPKGGRVNGDAIEHCWCAGEVGTS